MVCQYVGNKFYMGEIKEVEIKRGSNIACHSEI